MLLDLHANMTQTMLDYADALLGAHLYPHTDFYDRGVEAVELIPQILNGSVRPAMHLAALPMMIPLTTADLSPVKDINDICWGWENHPKVLDCAFFHGFAPADIPGVGVSVLVTTDREADLARQVSEDVARQVWDIRNSFQFKGVSPEEAFHQARATEGHPVVINEASDNPGGGPGDGTHLLRAMLDANLKEACFGYIYDPETTERAHRAGTGTTIDIELGGKTEALHGPPIRTRAYVKCLTDGAFVQQSPVGRGARVNLGKMARLVVADVDVLVSSVNAQTLDAEAFLLHGIDVTRYKIVAIKSSNHFRAGFEQIARKIIRADTPGLVSPDLLAFPYQRCRHPIWPLDPETISP